MRLLCTQAALFAGLAHQARRRFAVAAEVVHVDSTSFSVEGAHEREEHEPNETLIRITYGYSRDHRADLKQWQLSLATTTSEVPIGLQLLSGNASDRSTLAQQVAEVVYQFCSEREEEPIYVADSALYSEATMTAFSRKRVWWVSRVPETSLQAKALVAEEPVTWQGAEALRWVEREVRVGNRTERWIVACVTTSITPCANVGSAGHSIKSSHARIAHAGLAYRLREITVALLPL